jgi:broad specificity phosphatase PhoE
VHLAAARLPGPPLVVTHGGAIRALLASIPPEPGAAGDGAPARIPNGGVVRVALAAGRPVAAAWLDREG